MTDNKWTHYVVVGHGCRGEPVASSDVAWTNFNKGDPAAADNLDAYYATLARATSEAAACSADISTSCEGPSPDRRWRRDSPGRFSTSGSPRFAPRRFSWSRPRATSRSWSAV